MSYATASSTASTIEPRKSDHHWIVLEETLIAYSSRSEGSHSSSISRREVQHEDDGCDETPLSDESSPTHGERLPGDKEASPILDSSGIFDFDMSFEDLDTDKAIDRRLAQAPSSPAQPPHDRRKSWDRWPPSHSPSYHGTPARPPTPSKPQRVGAESWVQLDLGADVLGQSFIMGARRW